MGSGRRPQVMGFNWADLRIRVPPEPVLGSSWSLELQREGVSHAGSHAGHCAVAQHPRRWLVGYLRTCTRAPDTDASCCAAWGRSELQPFLRSAHWRCLRRCTREASYRTRCAISARADQHAIGTRGRVRISLWVQMQTVPGHTLLTMSVARARVAQHPATRST